MDKKATLVYMANYSKNPPLIVKVKGKRVVEIYRNRGFNEIERDEFNRIWQLKRSLIEKGRNAPKG